MASRGGGARLLRINAFTSTLATLDDAGALERLASRGQDVGQTILHSVRSRFLEGPAAPAWTPY